MSRLPTLIMIPALLAGCFGAARHNADLAYYDLGPMDEVGYQSQGLELRKVEVDSPSWLDSDAMQYRLSYANAARRESYAESRWVAPPAELVELALRRSMVANDREGLSGGCRLRLELDEFVQMFQTPDTSRGVIEVRAALLAPRSDSTLASRSFALSKPAPTQDARGGVAALSSSVRDLAAALHDWLRALDREGQQGLNVAQRCGGARSAKVVGQS